MATAMVDMTKQQQLDLVDVSPSNKNGIRYALDEPKIKERITIHNPTDLHVAFKVKRTMPKTIKVSPGYGFLKPKEFIFVDVDFENVEDLKEFEKADHHVSVVVCEAPLNLFSNAKKVWLSNFSPTVMSKKRIPVTCAVNKASEVTTTTTSGTTSSTSEESNTTETTDDDDETEDKEENESGTENTSSSSCPTPSSSSGSGTSSSTTTTTTTANSSETD